MNAAQPLQDTKTVIADIEKAAADTELRTSRRMEIGSIAHQGDLYVHRLPDNWKHGKAIATGQDSCVQVAMGTGNGARHMAEGDLDVFQGTQLPPGVTPPAGLEAMELCGPVIVARKPWRLTHPEHAHHELPEGKYGVTYQADPKNMRRVAD